MKYLVSVNKKPLIHISSGRLLSPRKFIHPRRNLNTFVIIVCLKGKLFIAQDNVQYILTENQYIILLAGHEHFGYQESSSELSYYWCHFLFENNDYHILSESELVRIFNPGQNIQNHLTFNVQGVGGNINNIRVPDGHFSQYYILPEQGDISTNGRAIIIFRQLLDLARKNSYSVNLVNYALSLLIMEISQEYIEKNINRITNKEINSNMEKIMEWIRVNYNLCLSVGKLAKMFCYNPDYLSTVFRRYTGIPLKKYITMVRISEAKKLLLNTQDSIKEIAYQVGFTDEKLFMKCFKAVEDVTPTKYRNAFSCAKIVK
jgi:AraC-like DNA-binding protein